MKKAILKAFMENNVLILKKELDISSSLFSYLRDIHKIELNNQQKQGVTSDKKHTLLLAVPGSGKTTVILTRIAYIIFNLKIKPKNIIALTFNKETVKDMEQKFESLFSTLTSENPNFCTIHSFCYNVIKKFCKDSYKKFPVLIDSNSEISSTNILSNIFLNINKTKGTLDEIDEIKRCIGCISNRCIEPFEYAMKYHSNIKNLNDIISEYKQYKRENNYFDFDDMLEYCLTIFITYPKVLAYYQMEYPYVLVDEAQDTSLLQHKIIRLLATKSNLFMVGDDDQSIYGFRGATANQLLEFDTFYGEHNTLNNATYVLEENFRATSKLTAHANNFIGQIDERYKKNMFSTRKGTREIVKINLSNYTKQFKKIPKIIHRYSKEYKIGILYKNNETSLLIGKYLLQNNMHYHQNSDNKAFFKNKIVTEILSFIKFIYDTTDINSFSGFYSKIGLSHSSFSYVSENCGKYQDVLKSLKSYHTKNKKDKAIITKLIKSQKKLCNKTPINVFKALINSFEYKNYLEYLTNAGFSGNNIVEKIHILYELLKDLTTLQEFFEYVSVISNINNNANAQITLSTIHSAKGKEYDVVILVDLIDGILPTQKAREASMEKLDEEIRLFYVAITRAKKHIVLFNSKKYKNNAVLPSPFIDDFLSKD